jgi:predicted Zn finger-like uncharacterized protein
MIITCEKCYAKFNLDENLLKQTGSKVRCSKCQNIFLAYPPIEMEKLDKPAEEIVRPEKRDVDLEQPDVETVGSGAEAESVEQDKVSEEKAELEDFDLSDIDSLLEESEPEETEPALEVEEEELDLSDLDLEETPETETKAKEEPEEVELELDAEPVAEETPEETELEFELEAIDKEELYEDEISAKKEITEEAKEESAETAALEPHTDQLEVEEVEELEEADAEIEKAPITTEKETKPVEKKRVSIPVLIALIIALLAAGAYGTYVALKSMNIKIPFISDLVDPAVQDETGNLKIIAFDITDKFIDNSKVGKLFIISGKVKSEYSGARSFIRVTGKVYACCLTRTCQIWI